MMLQQQQQQQQQAGTVVGSSGEDTVAAQEAHEGGGGGGSGGSGGGINEEEKGRSEDSERNSGGSRWPRQETIALLKIRSDMDVAFRDSSLKGPLWDEVSRKLSELGYHRSSKKCKEKFENVYKYHKRTKDGRNTKADGKTYRFFEQLEALDTNPSLSLTSAMKQQGAAHQTIFTSATLVGNSSTMNISSSPTVVTNVTVSSTPSPISTVFPSSAIHPINLLNIPSQPNVTNPTNPTRKPIGNHPNLPPSYTTHNANMDFLSNSTSSTSSDEQPERYGKRKRKWEDFFGRLMSEVMQKQDELQHKFLDTLEKRERDRVAREEAWRVQEMAKMNREHELLLQERSMAAAKDAAVISFLQKITEQQQKNSPNNPITVPPILNQIHSHLQTPPPQPPIQVPQQPAPTQVPAVIVTAPVPPPALAPTPTPAPVPVPAPMTVKRIDDMNAQSSNYNEGNDNAILMSPSPSRWPKTEVQALIKLRSTLDTKYHENGPKGPLWEEISSGMRKLGYNRNAKRCKEKWENINKYYKKVKESNKKRPEDAKTCPYFHQLEALYKEKAKTDNVGNTINQFNSNPINAAPLTIMAQPEQQWPVLAQENQQPQNKDEDLDDPNMNEDDYEDEDDEDDGAGYEIVTNKQHQQQQDRTTVE